MADANAKKLRFRYRQHMATADLNPGNPNTAVYAYGGVPRVKKVAKRRQGVPEVKREDDVLKLISQRKVNKSTDAVMMSSASYQHNGKYIVFNKMDRSLDNAHNLTDAEKKNVAGELGEALGELHERHIQHGDVASRNILLKDGADKVKLHDFGSRAAGAPGRQREDRRMQKDLAAATNVVRKLGPGYVHTLHAAYDRAYGKKG
jgi:serine/threonine protein kinase